MCCSWWVTKMRGFFAKYPQMHLNKNTGSHATIASIHSPKTMMTVSQQVGCDI